MVYRVLFVGMPKRSRQLRKRLQRSQPRAAAAAATVTDTCLFAESTSACLPLVPIHAKAGSWASTRIFSGDAATQNTCGIPVASVSHPMYMAGSDAPSSEASARGGASESGTSDEYHSNWSGDTDHMCDIVSAWHYRHRSALLRTEWQRFVFNVLMRAERHSIWPSYQRGHVTKTQSCKQQAKITKLQRPLGGEWVLSCPDASRSFLKFLFGSDCSGVCHA